MTVVTIVTIGTMVTDVSDVTTVTVVTNVTIVISMREMTIVTVVKGNDVFRCIILYNYYWYTHTIILIYIRMHFTCAFYLKMSILLLLLP